MPQSLLNEYRSYVRQQGTVDPEALETARQSLMREQAERNRYDISAAGRAKSRGLYQVGSNLASFGGMVGDMVGWEGLGKWGEDTSKALSEQAGLYPGLTLGDVAQSPLSAPQWAFEKIIEQAPNIGLMIASGGTGAAMSKLPALARIGANALTKAGVVAGTTALESGGTYQEVLERTGKRDPVSALMFGFGAGLVETLGGNIRVIDAIMPANKSKLYRNTVGRITTAIQRNKIPSESDLGIVNRLFKEARRQSIAEGLQEIVQEGLAATNLALHDPTYKLISTETLARLGEAGLTGAVVGPAYGAGAQFLPGMRTSLAREKAGNLTDEELRQFAYQQTTKAKTTPEEPVQTLAGVAIEEAGRRKLRGVDELLEQYVQETDQDKRDAIYDLITNRLSDVPDKIGEEPLQPPLEKKSVEATLEQEGFMQPTTTSNVPGEVEGQPLPIYDRPSGALTTQLMEAPPVPTDIMGEPSPTQRIDPGVLTTRLYSDQISRKTFVREMKRNLRENLPDKEAEKTAIAIADGIINTRPAPETIAPQEAPAQETFIPGPPQSEIDTVMQEAGGRFPVLGDVQTALNMGRKDAQKWMASAFGENWRELQAQKKGTQPKEIQPQGAREAIREPKPPVKEEVKTEPPVTPVDVEGVYQAVREGRMTATQARDLFERNDTEYSEQRLSALEKEASENVEETEGRILPVQQRREEETGGAVQQPQKPVGEETTPPSGVLQTPQEVTPEGVEGLTKEGEDRITYDGAAINNNYDDNVVEIYLDEALDDVPKSLLNDLERNKWKYKKIDDIFTKRGSNKNFNQAKEILDRYYKPIEEAPVTPKETTPAPKVVEKKEEVAPAKKEKEIVRQDEIPVFKMTMQPEEINNQEYIDAVNEAYIGITKSSGFSVAEISDVQKKSGVPLNWLQNYIMFNAKKGNAELYFGDWSLSDQDVRKAAIKLPGENPYLILKLKNAKAPVAPKVAEKKPEPTKEPQKSGALRGNKGYAYTPENEEIEFEYGVIDESELIASHTRDYEQNPNYPQELQPRERGRMSHRANVEQLAGEFNPNLVGESSLVSSGAPIVGEDNVVESGNGRMMALRLRYDRADKGKFYRDWLLENAERYGLSKDQISSIERPVLVRIRKTQMTESARKEFVRRANMPVVAESSPSETARLYVSLIPDEVWRLYSPDPEGGINVASNMDFLGRVAIILGKEIQTGIVNKKNKFTPNFITNIRSAVFYKAYQDDRILDYLAEEDINFKNIINGMATAAGRFIRAQFLDKSGDAQNVVDAIIGAVELIVAAKNEKITVTNLLNQSTMFDAVAPEVEAITKALDDYSRSGKKIGHMLSNLAGQLEARGRKDMQGMFENFGAEEERVDSKTLIRQAIKRFREEIEGAKTDEQEGLFDIPEVTEESATKGKRQVPERTTEKSETTLGTERPVGGKEQNIEDIFDQEEEKAFAPKKKTSKTRSVGKKTAPLKSAAKNIGKAASELKQAANDIINEYKKLHIVAGQFDPEFYKKIRGHFQRAWDAVQEAGGDVRDFVRQIIESFREHGEEFVYGLKPYVTKFYNEVTGNEKPSKDSDDTTRHEQERDRAIRRVYPEPPAGRPKLRVVQEKLLKEPRFIIDENTYAGSLGDDQIYAVNLALTRFQDGGPAFMLADGTGVGKTRQQLAIADQFSKTSNKPILIISQNKQILQNNYANDAQAMGIDINKFRLGTYTDLSLNKLNAPKGGYGLIIFDEAHNLKNMDSLKAVAGNALASDKKLFATATPMDTKAASAYFLGEITGKTREEIERLMGFETVQVGETDKGDPIYAPVLMKGHTHADVDNNLLELRNKAIADGAYLRREYPFYGSIETNEFEMTPEQRREQERIEYYWESRIEESTNPLYRARMAGQRTHELSRWTEIQKVDEAFNLVKQGIKEGKQVIVVAETVNQTTIKGLLEKKLTGFHSQLSAKLNRAGIDHAQIFGANKTVGPKSRKAIEADRFQRGEVKVALMTPQSGGVGIDLDDSQGSAPRVMHIMTLSFKGDEFMQTIGRVSRRNTQSPSEINLHFYPDAVADDRRWSILRSKLTILRKIIDNPNLDLDKIFGMERAVGEGEEATGRPKKEKKVLYYKDFFLTRRGRRLEGYYLTGDTYDVKDRIKSAVSERGNLYFDSDKKAWFVTEKYFRSVKNELRDMMKPYEERFEGKAKPIPITVGKTMFDDTKHEGFGVDDTSPLPKMTITEIVEPGEIDAEGNLVKKAKVRTSSGKGASGLFSVGESNKNGQPKKVVERFIKSIRKLFNLPIKVVESITELPQKYQGEARRLIDQKQIPRGLFDPDDNAIYLIAPAIQNRRTAIQVVLHEVVAHGGLRAIGKDFNVLLDSIYKNDKYRPEIDEYLSKTGTEAQRIAVEEWLARKVERWVDTEGKIAGPDATLWNRIVAWVRQSLRKLGINLKFNDSEVKELLRNAYRAVTAPVTQGATAQSAPAFSAAKTIEPSEYNAEKTPNIRVFGDPTWTDGTDDVKFTHFTTQVADEDEIRNGYKEIAVDTAGFFDPFNPEHIEKVGVDKYFETVEDAGDFGGDIWEKIAEERMGWSPDDFYNDEEQYLKKLDQFNNEYRSHITAQDIADNIEPEMFYDAFWYMEEINKAGFPGIAFQHGDAVTAYVFDQSRVQEPGAETYAVQTKEEPSAPQEPAPDQATLEKEWDEFRVDEDGQMGLFSAEPQSKGKKKEKKKLNKDEEYAKTRARAENEMNTGWVERVQKSVKKQAAQAGSWAKGWLKYNFMQLASRLEKIDPRLKGVMRHFEALASIRTEEDLKRIDKFIIGLQNIKRKNYADHQVVKQAISNPDLQYAEPILEKYGLKGELEEFRKTMDGLIVRAKEVGFNPEYLENYFTRMVRDLDGLKEYLEKESPGVIRDAIKAREKLLRQREKNPERKLSDLETANLISDLLLGKKVEGVKLQNYKQFKERTVKFIKAEMLDFYYDPEFGIPRYIRQANEAIEARRMFGKRAATDKYIDFLIERGHATEDDREMLRMYYDSQDPREYQAAILPFTIGELVQELVGGKKLTSEQEKEIQDVFLARLSYKTLHPFLNNLKALGYITSMGQGITSAITQIGDLGYPMATVGLRKTGESVIEALQKKSNIKHHEFMMQEMAAEFEHPVGAMKALDKIFKYTGLRYMDRIGKEVTVNAQLKVYREAFLPYKNIEDMPVDNKYRKYVETLFGNIAPLVFESVKGQLKNDNTKVLAYSILADFQPISISELPEGYVKHPARRLFYMLQTFTLKQFDVFRREAYEKMRNGKTREERYEGMKNLIRLGGMFALAGFTADEIKDLIMFRSDLAGVKEWRQIASEKSLEGLFRLIGVNRYMVGQMERYGLTNGVMRWLAPPMNFIEAPAKDIGAMIKAVKDKGPVEAFKEIPWALRDMETLELTPLVGNWYGRLIGNNRDNGYHYQKLDILDQYERFYRTPAHGRDVNKLQRLNSIVRVHNDNVMKRGFPTRMLITKESLQRKRAAVKKRITTKRKATMRKNSLGRARVGLQTPSVQPMGLQPPQF